MKEKICNILVICFLKYLAKFDKDFVLRVIKDFRLSKKQEKLMVLRYVEGEKFSNIPSQIYCEERYMYKLHKDAIDIIVSHILSYKNKQ